MVRKKMNDRLIDFGVQSGMLNYVDNETPRYYFVASNATIEELQNFAELIVRECIAICQDGISTQMTSSGAGERIRATFGIE